MIEYIIGGAVGFIIGFGFCFFMLRRAVRIAEGAYKLAIQEILRNDQPVRSSML